MHKLLENIRVLDLSRLLPGAYCTQHLADLGARVLKVEEPGAGDYIRHLNPWVFEAINRNKSSIVVDLKNPKGREIILQLIKRHDVLLESFRPGVMERFGLGYEVARGVNPGIVYCSLSGYGQNSPYKLKSGHDINYLAVAGILGLTAGPEEIPNALPLPLADLAGGLMASHAILAGLLGRNNSGKGFYLDVAIMDAALSLISTRFAFAMGTGKTSRQDIIREGAYGVYRTRDGRYITLGVIEDKFWGNLARAVGMPELAKDPRFSTDKVRKENKGQVRQILESILAERDLAEWTTLFNSEDVPAAPVNQLDELEADPQIRERGLIFSLLDESRRNCWQVAYPVLFPGCEQLENHAAPAMGRDTLETLSDLGFSEEEIQSMASEGIVSI